MQSASQPTLRAPKGSFAEQDNRQGAVTPLEACSPALARLAVMLLDPAEILNSKTREPGAVAAGGRAGSGTAWCTGQFTVMPGRQTFSFHPP
jgi:hypothetical protein